MSGQCQTVSAIGQSGRPAFPVPPTTDTIRRADLDMTKAHASLISWRARTGFEGGTAELPRLGIRLLAVMALAGLATATAPVASADNFRLNNGVVAHIYALQQLSGCSKELHVDPQLRQAAQWHTLDMLNDRSLNGDTGSDGSTPQDRALAAGYQGQVAETVSIDPASMAGSAFAANGIEVITQWQSNPDYLAIMTNCANTQIGVWSENSLDRMIVVAVYGTGWR
jgi:hypothetical protein